MAKRKLFIYVALFGTAMAVVTHGLADEVERDVCSCKLAQRGAQSTLKGGTCVRTETSSCLMEWGGGSTSKVPQGNGLPQQEASIRTSTEFARGADTRLEIPRLAPAADNARPLEIATANLSRVPPGSYDQSGVLESFVLAAGTALSRFEKVRLSFLGGNLLRSRRAQLLTVLQKEGEFAVEEFIIKGNTGCLQIQDLSVPPLNVFVKTPFASSDRC